MLVDLESRVFNAEWSLDGKHLSYHEVSQDDTQPNMWYLKPGGDSLELTSFFRTPANEVAGSLAVWLS